MLLLPALNRFATVHSVDLTNASITATTTNTAMITWPSDELARAAAGAAVQRVREVSDRRGRADQQLGIDATPRLAGEGFKRSSPPDGCCQEGENRSTAPSVICRTEAPSDTKLWWAGRSTVKMCAIKPEASSSSLTNKASVWAKLPQTQTNKPARAAGVENACRVAGFDTSPAHPVPGGGVENRIKSGIRRNQRAPTGRVPGW